MNESTGIYKKKNLNGSWDSVKARHIVAALIIIAAVCACSFAAQQAVQYKNFTYFSAPVKGIDFFASKRNEIKPYEDILSEVRGRLELLLGKDLPKGAIFICSTVEQKDSVYEPKVLRMGYDWTLTVITAEARAQEVMERMKAQMGDEIPAEILERMKSRSSGMNAEAERMMAVTLARQVAYAVIQTMFNENLRYRSSRIEDMGKSPLPDWLDIGIAAYATGVDQQVSFLQQHMDESFPIDDVLTMARPFVASTFTQNSGSGGGMMGRFGGGQGGQPSGSGGGQGVPPSGPAGGQGSFGRGGGQRGGFQRTIPKDEQDQMLFDGQSSTFFRYLMEKVGVEKVKELIQAAREGTESRDFIARPEVLGSDFEQIERDWAGWVATLNLDQNRQDPDRKGPAN